MACLVSGEYFASILRSLEAEEINKTTPTLVLVNGMGELSNGWGNLEALHKDGLLSLNADILGPLDETGEVSHRLDVTTDSEVAGVLGEEGALLVVLGGTGADNDFLSLYSFLYLILNTKSDTV